MTEFLTSDFARWTLVVIAAATVVLLIADAVWRWHTLPMRFKRTTPWLIALYASLTYAFAEVAAEDFERLTTSYKAGLFFASICGFAFALLLGFTDDD